jgi:hypothetical protein
MAVASPERNKGLTEDLFTSPLPISIVLARRSIFRLTRAFTDDDEFPDHGVMERTGNLVRGVALGISACLLIHPSTGYSVGALPLGGLAPVLGFSTRKKTEHSPTARKRTKAKKN